MSAGLPGLGLGGLFFIFSALLAPFPQLWRTVRGRSAPGDWRMVGRQFAQAAVMVAAIDLTLRIAYLGLSVSGLGDPPSADTGTVLPVTLIGITMALLVGVLAATKVAELAVRHRDEDLFRVPDRMPRPMPLRALAFTGAAAAAWFVLLAVGASELSPLGEPSGGLATEQRAGDVRSAPPGPPGRPSRPAIGSPGDTAAPRPGSADPRRATALPSREGERNGAGPSLQPSVSATPTAPTTRAPRPQGRPPATAPRADTPSNGVGGPGRESAPRADQPAPTGPPAGAGPPEGSRAPEHAGPPPHAGPG